MSSITRVIDDLRVSEICSKKGASALRNVGNIFWENLNQKIVICIAKRWKISKVQKWAQKGYTSSKSRVMEDLSFQISSKKGASVFQKASKFLQTSKWKFVILEELRWKTPNVENWAKRASKSSKSRGMNDLSFFRNVRNFISNTHTESRSKINIVIKGALSARNEQTYSTNSCPRPTGLKNHILPIGLTKSRTPCERRRRELSGWVVIKRVLPLS